MLYLYARVAYGPSRNADAAAMPDLTPRELALLVPIALAVLWMGVYPESFLAPMRNDVGAVLARLAPAAPASDAKVSLASGKTAPRPGTKLFWNEQPPGMEIPHRKAARSEPAAAAHLEAHH